LLLLIRVGMVYVRFELLNVNELFSPQTAVWKTVMSPHVFVSSATTRNVAGEDFECANGLIIYVQDLWS